MKYRAASLKRAHLLTSFVLSQWRREQAWGTFRKMSASLPSSSHLSPASVVHAKLLQSCPALCDPTACSLPGSSVYGVLQARILEWLPYPPSGDLPKPGIEPRSPALQVDSLLFEPLGKPKNIEVGSLSFLQGIFPSQE